MLGFIAWEEFSQGSFTKLHVKNMTAHFAGRLTRCCEGGCFAVENLHRAKQWMWQTWKGDLITLRYSWPDVGCEILTKTWASFWLTKLSSHRTFWCYSTVVKTNETLKIRKRTNLLDGLAKVYTTGIKIQNLFNVEKRSLTNAASNNGTRRRRWEPTNPNEPKWMMKAGIKSNSIYWHVSWKSSQNATNG